MGIKQFLLKIYNYQFALRMKWFGIPYRWNSEQRGITDVNEVSKVISEFLDSDKPCMIARYGSVELGNVVNAMGVRGQWSAREYIRFYLATNRRGRCWNEDGIKTMKTNAGFFPLSKENIIRFADMMLEDSKQLDVLGSWLCDERLLAEYIPKSVIKMDREKLNPFFAKHPWTLALGGKKVLVIHPFADSIIKQYQIKDKLFPTQVLPDFELKILKSVQSINGECDSFDDWFTALQWMKDQMDAADYDVALIGCGAYGFPLAAHAKRTGHKAIHVGGSLQLFFGIKGHRWESSGYVGTSNDYSKLFNEYWIRPSEYETPKSARGVEDACYW